MKQSTSGHIALEKIVVNSGIGRLATSHAQFEEKMLPELEKQFAAIVGQKPSLRVARHSIAGFKIRAGTPVGLTATLRGRRMKDFFMKFVNVVLPRTRDFRGIDPHAIDHSGNLSIGIKDIVVFPETNPESQLNFGMECTFVVSHARGRDDAFAFYRTSGILFRS